MLKVVNQSQTQTYLIEAFWLEQDKETHFYHMKAIARLNVSDKEWVDLGTYNYYRQAIEVFAQMDYNDNDLMYYRTNAKVFVMPGNITDERELDILFPVHPF